MTDLAQAVAILLEALDAHIDAKLAARPTNPTEIMTCAKAREESGYSTDTVSIWCQRGFITGATRRGKRGRWRFTREAWMACLQSRRIRRRHLAIVPAA